MTTNPTRRALLAGVGAAAAPPAVAAPSAAAHPDAELIRLGDALDVAWAVENRAFEAAKGEHDDSGPLTLKAQKAQEAASEIVARVEAIPATSLAGVLVKVRAIAWCRDGDPITAEDLDDAADPATECRLIAGVLNDLARLTGAAS
jgi:hypothetical protein